MKTSNQMAISAMSEMPQTKAELVHYNSLIKEATLSGEYDIIDIAKKVNMLGRVVDFFEKDKEIQALLLNEAEKYGKGEREDVQVRETGVKYHYSECGHKEYNRLLDEKKSIEERMKVIEGVLKLESNIAVDKETGEEFEFNKAAKSSSTKVVLTIK